MTRDERTPAAPHHDGSALHVDPVAPRLHDVVALRLRVPVEAGVTAVGVRVVLDGEPRHLPAARDGDADGTAWWTASIPMANPVVRYRWLVEADGDVQWVTACGTVRGEPRDADDFRLAADADPPSWSDTAVMYQVFPDRFGRSPAADARPVPGWARPAGWDDPVIHTGPATPAQLYGGDLDGIVERLDHLALLGVTVLYLTPFFPSRSNHRYDATSFDRVDPVLGGDEALVRLVAAAHERGLRVIGDLTTNHCGVGHEWFRAAHGRPGAPESAFFYWLDDAQVDYVSWLGHKSLPKLNWNSPDLRRRFIEGPDSVVAKWLQQPYGLDGWRIDVGNMTGRHAEDDLNRDVRRTIRDTMNAVKPDTLLIAEHTADPAPDLDGYGWHGAMTYMSFTRPAWAWLMRPDDRPVYAHDITPVLTPVRTGREFRDTNTRFTAALPWPAREHCLNALDSHDTPRFAGYALPGTVPVAFGLSATLPGIPFIWAGDELGLAASDGEHARTPMPWGAVEDAADLIGVYRRLIALRRAHPALQRGSLRWLAADDDAVAFVRESPEERVVVLAARTAARLVIDDPAVAQHPERLFGRSRWAPLGDRGPGVELAADGADFTVWALPPLEVPPPSRVRPAL